MEWTYNGKPFTDISSFFGFVYLITNLKTGKKYWGRKFFSKAGTKQVKGKKKKIRKSSDWLTYYGSNKELLEDVKTLGKENFTREILHLCNTRSECSYWEAIEILNNHALRRSDTYNSWLSLRITRNHCNAFKITP